MTSPHDAQMMLVEADEVIIDRETLRTLAVFASACACHPDSLKESGAEGDIDSALDEAERRLNDGGDDRG